MTADADADTPPDTPGDDTPADLGDAGRKALDAERKARRDAERRAHDAEERLKAIEAAELRRRVAAAKGLSETQAKRLHGETEEELTADADELLAAFKPDRQPTDRPPVAKLRPGAVPDAEPAPDYGSIAERIARGR